MRTQPVVGKRLPNRVQIVPRCRSKRFYQKTIDGGVYYTLTEEIEILGGMSKKSHTILVMDFDLKRLLMYHPYVHTPKGVTKRKCDEKQCRQLSNKNHHRLVDRRIEFLWPRHHGGRLRLHGK